MRSASARDVQEHFSVWVPVDPLQHRQQTAPDMGEKGTAHCSVRGTTWKHMITSSLHKSEGFWFDRARLGSHELAKLLEKIQYNILANDFSEQNNLIL